MGLFKPGEKVGTLELIRAIESLQETIQNHRLAINELGERENDMTVEFDALKAGVDTYKAAVTAAVTTLQGSVTDLNGKLAAVNTSLTTVSQQLKDANDELALPHEDIPAIVALTADITTQVTALKALVAPAAPVVPAAS